MDFPEPNPVMAMALAPCLHHRHVRPRTFSTYSNSCCGGFTSAIMWLPGLLKAGAAEVFTMQGGQVLLKGAPEDALEVPQEALHAAW